LFYRKVHQLNSNYRPISTHNTTSQILEFLHSIMFYTIQIYFLSALPISIIKYSQQLVVTADIKIFLGATSPKNCPCYNLILIPDKSHTLLIP